MITTWTMGETPGHDLYEVFLDGSRLADCFHADVVAGVALCYVTDEHGQRVTEEDRWTLRPKVIRRYGSVEIRRCNADPFPTFKRPPRKSSSKPADE